MGEQHASDDVPSNKEQTPIPLRQRLHEYAKTWWRERGGPGGVTEAHLRSIDEIHAAIPPGSREVMFREKIKPLLMAQAKVSGVAAMVGEVTLAAMTTTWLMHSGRRAAQGYETTVQEGIEELINNDDVRSGLEDYRNQPSQFDNSPSATVIDSETKAIIPGDPGFRRSRADDIVDGLRIGGRIVSAAGGAVIRGSGALAGVAAGAAVLERGPVHAAAKLGAKAEGAAGVAVVKIVDRIVKGWTRPNGKVDTTKPQQQ